MTEQSYCCPASHLPDSERAGWPEGGPGRLHGICKGCCIVSVRSFTILSGVLLPWRLMRPRRIFTQHPFSSRSHLGWAPCLTWHFIGHEDDKKTLLEKVLLLFGQVLGHCFWQRVKTWFLRQFYVQNLHDYPSWKLEQTFFCFEV